MGAIDGCVPCIGCLLLVRPSRLVQAGRVQQATHRGSVPTLPLVAVIEAGLAFSSGHGTIPQSGLLFGLVDGKGCLLCRASLPLGGSDGGVASLGIDGLDLTGICCSGH